MCRRIKIIFRAAQTQKCMKNFYLRRKPEIIIFLRTTKAAAPGGPDCGFGGGALAAAYERAPVNNVNNLAAGTEPAILAERAGFKMSNTDIDGCISRIKNLRKNDGELSDLLTKTAKEAAGKTANGEFLPRGVLERAAEQMRSHGKLLKNLEEEVKEISPEIKLERYDEVVKALENLKGDSIESMREALEKFQRLELKAGNPKAEEPLKEYQKKALDILGISDIQEIIRLAKPYRVFIDIIEKKITDEDFTEEQDNLIREFPFALRQIVWKDAFSIKEIKDSGTKPPKDDGDIPKKHIPPILKKDPKSDVKAFEKLLSENDRDKENILKFIYELSWNEISAGNRLKEIFPDAAYPRLIDLLYKDGYVKLFENKLTHDKFYYFSRIGRIICKDEKIRGMIKLHHGPLPEYSINNFIMSLLQLKNRFLSHREIEKDAFMEGFPQEYGCFKMLETVNGEKMLILPSGTIPYLGINGLKDAVSLADIVFLYTCGSSADIDPERLAQLKTKRLYYVSAESTSEENYCCKDVNGMECELASLLGRPPEPPVDGTNDTVGTAPKKGSEPKVTKGGDDKKSGAGEKDEKPKAAATKSAHSQNKPEPKAVTGGTGKKPDEEPSENKISFEEGTAQIISLLAEKRIMEATVLAKAYTFLPQPEGNLFKTFYRRLSYAVNMRMDLPVYTSADIKKLEISELELSVEKELPENLYKMLRLSTFAWALCRPRIEWDYDLYKYKDGVLQNADDFKVKGLFMILFEVINSTDGQGFRDNIVKAFIQGGKIENDISTIEGRAAGLRGYNTDDAFPGAKEMYDACFDSNSELGKCMRILDDGNADENEKRFVKETMKKFDSTTIDNYVDDKWKNEVPLSPKDRPPKVTSRVRNNLKKNLERRVKVCNEWLEGIGNLDNKFHDNKKIAEARNKLITEIKAVLEGISGTFKDHRGAQRAGFAVIENTLLRICKFLEGEKDKDGENRNYTPLHDKWDYIDLLKSHYISLRSDSDGDAGIVCYIPALKEDMRSIPGFEPWTRVLAHINAKTNVDMFEFNAVWNLITDANRTEPGWFKNYGSAKLIEEYLVWKKERETETTDYPTLVTRAKKDAEEEGLALNRELEYAYAYGQIEDNEKEDIYGKRDGFKAYFFEETKDFAQYTAFLGALRSRIESSKERITRDRKNEFDGLRDNDEKIDDEIAGIMNKALVEGNLIYAEEILIDIRRGKIDSVKKDAKEREEEGEYKINHLEMFLEPKDHKTLYDLCKTYKLSHGLSWAADKTEIKARLSDLSPEQREKSRRLLECWPQSKSRSIRESVIDLLKRLGFKTGGDSGAGASNGQDRQIPGNRNLIISVSIEKSQKNSPDYNHPIAPFGTEIKSPVNVVCLFEEMTMSAIKKFLVDQKLAENTFILVDKAYSLEDRQNLARLLKSEIRQTNTFLVIDRVLMLYLATLDDSLWLPALLECTLPYTKCQPYAAGDHYADEMFFGRDGELDTIRDYKGATLVYGGRRLGKTALLRRACNLEHDPDNNKYAAFIDLKETKSKAEAVQVMSKTLNYLKFLDKEINSTKELCAALRNRMNKDKKLMYQLYIDEVDIFFKEIEANDDHADLLAFKTLHDDFPDRFKVVFAGLHKVVHSKNTSAIPHMGKHLCIKPFTQSEARKLVKTPLAYLGFRFSGKEGKEHLAMILANTNYYPGLLHQYCYELVNSVNNNYEEYYGESGASGNPPFILQKEHLSKTIDKAGLNDKIREFFKLNLEVNVDIDYNIAANVIAYLSREQGLTYSSGFSLDEIRNCGGLKIPKLSKKNMSDRDLGNLLSEMDEMNILLKLGENETARYRLRKNSFLNMLGNEDTVMEAVLKASYDEEGK